MRPSLAARGDTVVRPEEQGALELGRRSISGGVGQILLIAIFVATAMVYPGYFKLVNVRLVDLFQPRVRVAAFISTVYRPRRIITEVFLLTT